MVYAGIALPPHISVSLTDSLNDTNMDGKANPGETIDYEATVESDGISTATGAVFSNTIDATTTLVPGSVRATPVTLNDPYDCIGNVGLTVLAANGVLSNDFDPDGTGNPLADLTAVVASGATSQGGFYNLAADGSFTYEPPAGFTGNDGFTYTVTDAHGLGDASATPTSVEISVAGVIWFVQSGAAGDNTGTFGGPVQFCRLFNAANGGGAASLRQGTAFVHTGSYTGGVACSTISG
ncbi:MAG: Ig-like domain-containing protein [Verrucomicrobiales bacterium]